MEKQAAVHAALTARGLSAQLMNYDFVVGVASAEPRVAVKSPEPRSPAFAPFWDRPTRDIADDLAEALEKARRPN